MLHPEPLLLVDLSYYVCYRYFALRRWAAVTKREFATPEELGGALSEAFAKGLDALRKKYGCGWEHVCLCRDVPRPTIWRAAHYPAYKQTRDDRQAQRDDAETAAFCHAYEVMVPAFLAARPGVRALGSEGAEADDVMAGVHGLVRAQHPDQRVVVVTGDGDLLQLADERTELVDARMQSICGRLPPELAALGSAEARRAAFVRWKALKGDKSDNIPAVAAGLGEKRSLKLALDPDGALRALLERDAGARERYELNELLMSFDRIPAAVRQGVEAAWRATQSQATQSPQA